MISKSLLGVTAAAKHVLQLSATENRVTDAIKRIHHTDAPRSTHEGGEAQGSTDMHLKKKQDTMQALALFSLQGISVSALKVVLIT